ncbi:C4-dicarboxylate TRAP transporter substrate-binding protein [Bacillus sp. 1P02SD]|uniref:C4-dicarboxylate TRAP transporter substrate-binding protein n=1 Tax=Bacillus sp. 1P02SD TaxID=3132264 RepID=UPI00399FCF78
MEFIKSYKGYIFIASLFWCFTMLVACSDKESSTSNGDENESIVLKTTIQTPQVALLSKGFDAYLDAIEEESDGRIKFERYYSESLAKTADVLDALSAGIADVGVIVPPLVESKIPLNNVGHSPAVYENVWAGSKAHYELYENNPELNEELEKNGVTFGGQLAVASSYVFTKEPIKSSADLKGLRMVALGDHGILAQELGAVPVSIPSTETFEALQRGTVDGVFFNLTTATTYNYEEVAGHVYKLPIGGVALLIGIGKDKFDSLPKDLQEIIKEVGKNQADEFHRIYQTEGDKVALEKIEAANGTVTEATPEDIKELKEIAKNVIWKKWVEKNGSSSQKILDQFVELSEKYEKENPFKGE